MRPQGCSSGLDVVADTSLLIHLLNPRPGVLDELLSLRVNHQTITTGEGARVQRKLITTVEGTAVAAAFWYSAIRH